MTFSSIVFFYEPTESRRPLGWLLGVGRASLVVAGKPGLKPKETQKALEQLKRYDYSNQLLLLPQDCSGFSAESLRSLGTPQSWAKEFSWSPWMQQSFDEHIPTPSLARKSVLAVQPQLQPKWLELG